MSASLPLMHGATARRLLDDIAASRHVEPERVPTLEAIDSAIQWNAETWCDVEGVPRGGTMPDFDYDTPRWGEIVDGVLRHLELDYDEVFEVAP